MADVQSSITLRELSFNDLVKVYVDLFVEKRGECTVSLGELVSCFSEFCTDNIWVKCNRTIKSCVTTKDDKDHTRQLRGTVQAIAHALLCRKFGTVVYENKSSIGGCWKGISLSHPTTKLSQSTMHSIPPDRLTLLSDGAKRPLVDFMWSRDAGIINPPRALGSGTYGTVYAAELACEQGGTMTVALKVFKKKEAAAYATNEGASATQIRGANGVAAFLGGCIDYVKPQHAEVASENERLSYLVYKKYSSDLKLADTLAVSEKLGLLKDVVRGMVELHCKNVVHRDLRAANVLVERIGSGTRRAVIGDVGIATFANGVGPAMRARDDRRDEGRIWMPPEYGSDQEGTWSDVFAMSSLTLRMLLHAEELKDASKAQWRLNPILQERSGVWGAVASWIILARADDVAARRDVSLLHLAHALLRASFEGPTIPPRGFFKLGSAVGAPERPAAGVAVKRKRVEDRGGHAVGGEKNTALSKAKKAAPQFSRGRLLQNVIYQSAQRSALNVTEK